jgi:hypothetical protein
MAMAKTIEDRVRLGAKFLDAHHPGWAAEIDTWQLEMWSCSRCILGQLHGGSFWEDATVPGPSDADKVAFGLDWSEAVRLGFAIDDRESYTPGYDSLLAAWLVEVRARTVATTTDGGPTI